MAPRASLRQAKSGFLVVSWGAGWCFGGDGKILFDVCFCVVGVVLDLYFLYVF